MTDETDDDGRSVAFWVLVVVAALVFLVIAAVIGSAVIASFVLGFGEDVEPSPTATFSVQAGDPVTVTHDGGDAMDAGELVVTRNGEEVGTWASLSDGSVEEVTAGDDVAVSSASEGDTIGVVWTGGEERFPLAEMDVDEA